MSKSNIELVAAYFTLAGDVYPFGPTEISPFSFRCRVEAAAKAGWAGIGLIHSDIWATADKIGFAEMRHILEANGIKHVEFEFLVDWYHTGERRRTSDSMCHYYLKAAEELHARIVKVGPGIGEDTADVALMVNEFGKLAEDAEKRGTQVMLEIMPFSNVRTIETGRAIVEGANKANAGLLLDVWHLSRGNVDFNEIANIKPGFIKGIELDDADRYAVEPLWMDTIHKRRLPGEGVLDVKGFIKAVQATGFDGPWGVEILSEVERKLPLEEMAARAYNATIRQFEN
ncbi:sugar phosphate isomerase/epimerase family protein [Cupriavidus consociatus]|uniref:sugar phosphate isomerase/epimerase family protein n=1 Tax=Cupriavidus consociatus TaxID=2821357 RepID=UPI001AE8EFE8|nr:MULTISPECIES: sugar phosphate isomerase/epimerase family protein [unclassified Cupriavidus]MBP0624801.1 sugar phosphate isomerase/epimerase [Cupriavidus sp. LEh25]MDK2661523.1 sugar phosphate isomerase/epimerase family protein [Cupriavidus sp. LEh21]